MKQLLSMRLTLDQDSSTMMVSCNCGSKKSAEPSPLHACMTHAHVTMYSMAHCVCLFNIRSIALHLNRVLVLFSSESVGVWERHLTMSLYKL